MYVPCEEKLHHFIFPSFLSKLSVMTIFGIYTVSQKTSPMFLAITRESIVGFS